MEYNNCMDTNFTNFLECLIGKKVIRNIYLSDSSIIFYGGNIFTPRDASLLSSKQNELLKKKIIYKNQEKDAIVIYFENVDINRRDAIAFENGNVVFLQNNEFELDNVVYDLKTSNIISYLENLNIDYNDQILYARTFAHPSLLVLKEESYSLMNTMAQMGTVAFNLYCSKTVLKENIMNKSFVVSMFMRSLCNETTMGTISSGENLYKFVRLGASYQDNIKDNKKENARFLRALVGVLYFDTNFENTTRYIDYIVKKYSKIIEQCSGKDPKSEFQEFIQGRKTKEEIKYRYKMSGHANTLTFVCNIFVGGKFISSGTGKSKKEASSSAAKNALIKLK